MEPRAHYLTVGLFAIGLIVLFVLGILWFSGVQHKIFNTYQVYMNESVSGLSVEAPVKFNGVEVGYVADIELDPQNSQRVRLLLKIENGTPINQSTKAALMTQGITGVMFIGLKASAVNAPPLKKAPGETYPTIDSDPSVLVQLDTMLREINNEMRKISKGFQTLLSTDNQKSISTILSNASDLSGTLKERSQELGKSLKTMDETLKDSQIAMKGFSEQILPTMVNGVNRFNQLLDQMEPIAHSLQDNPSVLLRGKAPEALGPGE